jgi:hypothetical protein
MGYLCQGNFWLRHTRDVDGPLKRASGVDSPLGTRAEPGTRMMPPLWMLTEHVEAIHLLRKSFRSTLHRVLAAQQRASVNMTGLASATAKLLTELAKDLVCLCTANSGKADIFTRHRQSRAIRLDRAYPMRNLKVH